MKKFETNNIKTEFLLFFFFETKATSSFAWIFPLLPIQDEQLSVTGKRMGTTYR